MACKQAYLAWIKSNSNENWHAYDTCVLAHCHDEMDAAQEAWDKCLQKYSSYECKSWISMDLGELPPRQRALIACVTQARGGMS